MGIQYNVANIHWNFFLGLEDEFSTVTRYVEPCDENNNTFSVEIARLLMSAAQESDVVMKAICTNRSPFNNPNSINGYFPVLQLHEPELFECEVSVPRYGMRSRPFEDWSYNSPPAWWTANNHVKHKRDTHFASANLKNAYNALSGLLLVIYFLNRKNRDHSGSPSRWLEIDRELIPESRLFKFDHGDIGMTFRL